MTETVMTQEFIKEPIEVERAKPEDAEAVSELLRQTWLATYPSTEAGITEEDIRLRTDGENGERIPQNIDNWRKRIETNDGSVAVFVARTGDKIAGMAAPGIIDGKRRIGAMYVLPETQGKGVGSQLMQKALEWHGDKEDIYLLVASYNQNAINFYKRFGFEQTDRAVVDEGNVYGNTRIPEIEMMLKAKNPDSQKSAEIEQNLTLRPATEDDTEFARTTHHTAYRGVIARQFGTFDEVAQDDFFHKSWNGNVGFQIINWGGQLAGYTRVEETPEYIYGHELVLLPEYQSKGIGSFLLNSWQENAKNKNISLKLQVLKENKAKELYERVGFVETGQTNTHYEMEWSPNS